MKVQQWTPYSYTVLFVVRYLSSLGVYEYVLVYQRNELNYVTTAHMPE